MMKISIGNYHTIFAFTINESTLLAHRVLKIGSDIRGLNGWIGSTLNPDGWERENSYLDGSDRIGRLSG
jgi:hypothetical protein